MIKLAVNSNSKAISIILCLEISWLTDNCKKIQQNTCQKYSHWFFLEHLSVSVGCRLCLAHFVISLELVIKVFTESLLNGSKLL